MAKKTRTAVNDYFDATEKIFAVFETQDAARCLSAAKAAKREVEEFHQYREEVRVAIGSDNYGNALRTLKAKGLSGKGLFALPLELEKIPQLWLVGRVPTGTDKGCRRYSLFEAKQEHRRLRIYLEDAWTAILSEPEEDQEQLKADLIESYENNDPERCALFCEAFTKDYNLEQILAAQDEEEQPLKKSKKVERAASVFEESESLRLVTQKSSYGVGGTLEQPTWD